ncbi:hypothetical protein PIB30_077655 [Stylosanthes scabra]|uniref:CCHC-type domain-containing protein n=1 Tax=Stylosanthes scabra TaxID=79078 RepID=A0ABU6RRI2_9FABA|nr:hypothetical protein [Stylosanthes scabra]
MNPNKVRKTFEVTCNKCGEKGHYYKTCKNYPQDPNWKPMTKKERRTAKGGCASTATANSSQPSHTQVETEVMDNAASNVNNPNMDPDARARKNKQKIPKPGVRVKPQKKKPQSDEIPISQSAPNTEEGLGNTSSQTLGQGATPQPATSSGTAARLFRYMPTPGFKPPRPK